MKDAFAFLYEIVLKNEKRASEPMKFKDALAFNACHYTPSLLICQAPFMQLFYEILRNSVKPAVLTLDKTVLILYNARQ